MSVRHVLLFLLLAVSRPAAALDTALRPSQWVMDKWETTEGLPEATVQTMARTADGYLWLGTEDGLARFDGVRFSVMTHATEPRLPDNYISVLYVDGLQRLWVGTHAGMARIEHGALTPAVDLPRLGTADIRAITEDRLGVLWVGAHSGLISIDPTTNSPIDRSGALHDHRVQALAADGAGSLWVGTAAGLERFDGKHFERYALNGDLDASITAIHADADGIVWVGTGTGALYRRETDQFILVLPAGRFGSAIRPSPATGITGCGSGSRSADWSATWTGPSRDSPTSGSPKATRCPCSRTLRGICGSGPAAGCGDYTNQNFRRGASPRDCRAESFGR